MTRMIRRNVSVCLLLPMLACAGARPIDRESEARAIRALDDQWNQAMARKDVEATIRFFAGELLLLEPQRPQRVLDRRAQSELWTEAFALPGFSFVLRPIQVEVAGGGGMAWDAGTYHMGWDTPKGRVEREGKYLDVWKKLTDGWKVTVEIHNSTRTSSPP
jgi:ketosteroid isomerase-like protein